MSPGTVCSNERSGCPVNGNDGLLCFLNTNMARNVDPDVCFVYVAERGSSSGRRQLSTHDPERGQVVRNKRTN